MTSYRTETREFKRERERNRQNRIPVIAKTCCWKKLLHKLFSWALNRLFFLLMRYFKWMRMFKKWFNRFFLCSAMKLEFLFQLKLNNNYLYSFGHKEKVDLFVCFVLKCERTSAFFVSFLIVCPTIFRCASTVTIKVCPYVINT